MKLTCPVCRKVNDGSASDCVRCGASHARLRAVVAAAWEHCQAAASLLQRRDYDAVLDHAEQSWQLCHNRPTVPIACLAAAAGGYPDELRIWRLRWRAVAT